MIRDTIQNASSLIFMPSVHVKCPDPRPKREIEKSTELRKETSAAAVRLIDGDSRLLDSTHHSSNSHDVLLLQDDLGVQ
jgi:hypothetical protein